MVVEPGLHQPFGHMRGELELFLSGLRANKVPFQVVGSRPPASPVPADWNLALPPALWIQFCESLPPRLGIRLIEFLTYRLALRLGGQKRCPVIGLTSSGPFGLALAAIGRPFAKKRLFIIYHLGSVEKRYSLWRLAYCVLLRIGVNIGTYALPVQKRLQTAFPGLKDRVHFFPTLAAVEPLANKCPNEKPVLMVSGLDSAGRRTPVAHLLSLKRISFPKIVFHEPEGRFEGVDELEKAWGHKIEICRDSCYYLKEYSHFLSKADGILIAYDPDFLNPSSILRHAVCAGVPLICSHFPFADFLTKKFGRIGEFWNYGNPRSLEEAMVRLQAWKKEDFAEFLKSVKNLRAWFSPPSAVWEHLNQIGFYQGRVAHGNPWLRDVKISRQEQIFF